jgi:tetratricopeptide (TPR) repeat protein
MKRQPPPSSGDSVMKWVTRGSAVLALLFAVIQLVRLVSDTRDRQRQIGELTRVEEIQARAGDYPGAWATLDQAIKIAESGGVLSKMTGQLGADARALRTTQEDLAMAWVENLSHGEGKTFSEVAEKLTPVMTRGAANATGARKGDLLAHLGWASFLESRDAHPSPDAMSQYRAALAVDPSNPYAHAFLGHFFEQQREPMDKVMAEFAAALAANRARPYVRRLQLAAADNRQWDGFPALVAVVNDMRKQGEPVSDDTRHDLYSAYTFGCGFKQDADHMRLLLDAAPAAEQVATLRALFYDPSRPPGSGEPRTSLDACLATLLEAAGDRDEALKTWRALHQTVATHDVNGLAARSEAAIKRLGG